MLDNSAERTRRYNARLERNAQLLVRAFRKEQWARRMNMVGYIIAGLAIVSGVVAVSYRYLAGDTLGPDWFWPFAIPAGIGIFIVFRTIGDALADAAFDLRLQTVRYFDPDNDNDV